MAGQTVIALLLFFLGMDSIVWGMALGGIGGLGGLTSLFFPSSVQAWGNSAFGFGVLAILVGIVEVITSFALFARKKWARNVALVTSGISLVLSLVGLINGSYLSLPGIVLPAVVFIYLLFNRPPKRALRGG